MRSLRAPAEAACHCWCSHTTALSSATATETRAIPRHGMKPTLSTSWRLRRRQSAISANAKSTAAAMLTDSMDGCIRFLSFALCGDDPQPPHPQREVPDMRPFLFVASVALIALTEIGRDSCRERGC